MQTLEFTRALKEIAKELKAAEIVDTVQKWLQATSGQPNSLTDQDKDGLQELLLTSRSGYDRLEVREATGKILRGLGIKEFYDAGRIRQLMMSLSNLSQLQQVRGVPDVQAYLERFKSLQRLSTTCEQLLETEKIGTVAPSEGIVEVELITYADEDGLSPLRLEKFIPAIVELHTNLAIVLAVPPGTLTFKYFDSGSGVVMGIQCAKEIAGALNTLLTQWWDKIRFWRYDTFEKRMEAISSGLTVAETVHEAVNKGTITEEEGRNLKLRILRRVDDLVGLGATIPLGDKATVDQKQLLTEMRNTKLLVSGEPAEGENKGVE
jgi:hypothetical protein